MPKETDYELKQIQNLIVPKLTSVLTETEAETNLTVAADELQTIAEHEQSNLMDLSITELYSDQEPIATETSAQQSQQRLPRFSNRLQL